MKKRAYPVHLTRQDISDILKWNEIAENEGLGSNNPGLILHLNTLQALIEELESL